MQYPSSLVKHVKEKLHYEASPMFAYRDDYAGIVDHFIFSFKRLKIPRGALNKTIALPIFI